jgi:GMP synthase (glutamine-hydrolysing)
VKPFLLLGSRDDDGAADNEYAAFLAFTGLTESSLRRVRLERGPLGDVDLSQWSGIFLGGGPFNSSDSADLKSAVQHRVEEDLRRLLDVVVAQDFPFFGACYGIGTLGTHQGAVVDRTYTEPVGAVTVSLTDAGCADPLTGVLSPSFEAFTGHKEAIRSLPPHAVNLAASSTCPVQAFRVGRNVYATQFHPELDIEGLCLRIDVYRHSGYFAPEEADDIKEMARSSRVTEPPWLLRRFVELYGDAPAADGDSGQQPPRWNSATEV